MGDGPLCLRVLLSIANEQILIVVLGTAANSSPLQHQVFHLLSLNNYSKAYSQMLRFDKIQI
jgi:hypothetical protein